MNNTTQEPTSSSFDKEQLPSQQQGGVPSPTPSLNGSTGEQPQPLQQSSGSLFISPPPSSASSLPPISMSFPGLYAPRHQQEPVEDPRRSIDAWRKTFNERFAAFVLFANGTGVVFLKKHLTTSNGGSSGKEIDLLCEKAIGLMQHCGYLSPSKQVNTAVNRLKDGMGWMLQFNSSPHILTYVSPASLYPEPPPASIETLSPSSSSSSPKEDQTLLAQLGFMRRNLDASQLSVLYVQTCLSESSIAPSHPLTPQPSLLQPQAQQPQPQQRVQSQTLPSLLSSDAQDQTVPKSSPVESRAFNPRKRSLFNEVGHAEGHPREVAT